MVWIEYNKRKKIFWKEIIYNSMLLHIYMQYIIYVLHVEPVYMYVYLSVCEEVSPFLKNVIINYGFDKVLSIRNNSIKKEQMSKLKTNQR
jgi:hypothetical protein